MKCLEQGKKECPHFTWKESIAIGELIEKTRKNGESFMHQTDAQIQKGQIEYERNIINGG